MTVPRSTTTHEADVLAVGRGVWIDVLLVVASVWCVAAGWHPIAAALLALGVVLPVVRWLGIRRNHMQAVAHLVPSDVMDSHARVLAAAALPGVLDVANVIEASDDIVFEVAAVLAGRPPRGASQWRFVDVRVRAMNGTASELEERHRAWIAARAEVDAIAAGIVLPDPPPQTRDGVLVRMFVVVLFPCFAAWDAVRLGGRGAVRLVDGLALRARTVARVVARTGRGFLNFLRTAVQRWTDLRERFVDAAREARHRFLALRVRVRIRLRDARRRLRPSR
ncbi:MAG: hypothetical protein QOG30_1428 [Acidimicrobiaceae bacterium]